MSDHSEAAPQAETDVVESNPSQEMCTRADAFLHSMLKKRYLGEFDETVIEALALEFDKINRRAISEAVSNDPLTDIARKWLFNHGIYNSNGSVAPDLYKSLAALILRERQAASRAPGREWVEKQVIGLQLPAAKGTYGIGSIGSRAIADAIISNWHTSREG